MCSHLGASLVISYPNSSADILPEHCRSQRGCEGKSFSSGENGRIDDQKRASSGRMAGGFPLNGKVPTEAIIEMEDGGVGG